MSVHIAGYPIKRNVTPQVLQLWNELGTHLKAGGCEGLVDLLGVHTPCWSNKPCEGMLELSFWSQDSAGTVLSEISPELRAEVMSRASGLFSEEISSSLLDIKAKVCWKWDRSDTDYSEL